MESWCFVQRNYCKASGFDVVLGEHVFSVDGPFAGSDDERLRDLQQATDDPSVKAVLCSRGGYGMSRIVDRVDYSALKKHPKWYVGYSDITSLHLWLNTGMRHCIAACRDAD